MDSLEERWENSDTPCDDSHPPPYQPREAHGFLKELGFVYDPRDLPPAELMPPGIHEALRVELEGLREKVLSLEKHSAVFGSPGCGMTFIRRWVELEAQKQTGEKGNVLVVSYVDFGPLVDLGRPPRLRDHAGMLCSAVAEAALRVICRKSELFLNELSLLRRSWWWSYLKQFLGAERLLYRIKDNSALKDDFLQHEPKEPPFQPRATFPQMLSAVLQRLEPLGYSCLLVLVDNLDGDARVKTTEGQWNLIEALFGARQLLNIPNLIWKYFLIAGMEVYAQQTLSQESSLERYIVEWKNDSLREQSKNLLLWAYQNSEKGLAELFKPTPFVKNVDPDMELAALALGLANEGAPRIQSSILRQLLKQLQINNDLLTPGDWQQGIREGLALALPVMHRYRQSVVAIQAEVREGEKQIVGTGFLTHFNKMEFILTCRHVVKQATEMEVFLFDEEQPRRAKVLTKPWDETSNGKNVPAKQDIAVLTFVDPQLHGSNLDDPLRIISASMPPALISPESALMSNGWAFGYRYDTGLRGIWVRDISLVEKNNRGFYTLHQSGDQRINKGMSGAPFGTPAGILGMVQSFQGEQNAYLIPSQMLLKVLAEVYTKIIDELPADKGTDTAPQAECR